MATATTENADSNADEEHTSSSNASGEEVTTSTGTIDNDDDVSNDDDSDNKSRPLSTWTLWGVLCLVAFTATCVGFALLLVSIIGDSKAASDPTTTPSLVGLLNNGTTTDGLLNASALYVEGSGVFDGGPPYPLPLGGGSDDSGSDYYDASRRQQYYRQTWLQVREALVEQEIVDDVTALLFPDSPQARALGYLASTAAASGKPTTTEGTLSLAERYALAVLYFHWNGPLLWKNDVQSPTNLEDDGTTASPRQPWLSLAKPDAVGGGGATECSWIGLECDENRTSVVAINLSSPDIFAPVPGSRVPSELGLLSTLQRLLLPDLGLQGSIPSNLFSRLTNLVELDLQANQLTSVLTTELSQLTNLQVLRLQHNHLRDTIGLEEFALFRTAFRKMKVWDVSHNQELRCYYSNERNDGWFYDNVSEDEQVTDVASLATFLEFAATYWPRLEEFDLSHTGIVSRLPSESRFGQNTWSRLTTLGLSNTMLIGTIPPSIGKLTKLKQLALNHPLSLPSFLSSLLEEAVAIGTTASHGLYGTLPTELGRLTKLELLAVDANQFDASVIPTELGLLGNLKLLSLQYNGKVAGTIPTEVGGMRDLEILFLAETGLSGPVPSELGRCTNLIHAEFQLTELTGSIPAELCDGRIQWKGLMADCIPEPFRSGSSAVDIRRSVLCDCCTECFG